MNLEDVIKLEEKTKVFLSRNIETMQMFCLECYSVKEILYLIKNGYKEELKKLEFFLMLGDAERFCIKQNKENYDISVCPTRIGFDL